MENLSKEAERAVDLLFQTNKQSSKKKILDNDKTIYLQVALFKVPFAPSRKRKFLRLRHSLYGNDPEICLFVPNRKTGVTYKKTTEELIDFCVDHYIEILEKHKVKGIKTIMPLKQLRSEYGTYELKRKLVQRFDLFLCKNSLLYNSRFLTSLGKIFKVSNKEPLGVSFPKEGTEYDPEFQRSIKRAIFTSSFYISPFSDNYSIPFGCSSNSKEELLENLQMVLRQLLEEEIIPGGFENIRALYLWPSQCKPVPLYISSELPLSVKKPKLKVKRKRVRGVEDEITTQPQKKVFVTPKGDVFVTKVDKVLEDQESEGEESFRDESDDDDDDDGGNKEESSKPKRKKSRKESESDDDEEIEEQEAVLLEHLGQSESDYQAKGASVQHTEKSTKTQKKENGRDTRNKSSKNGNLGKTKQNKEKAKKPKKKLLTKGENFPLKVRNRKKEKPKEGKK